MARIAIIGAGLAGLVLAGDLVKRHDVVVYEKSRGSGGRMATRYAGEFEFDHGAQFFTARTEAFRRFLGPLIDRGLVAPWLARFAEFSGASVTARRNWTEDYPHFVGVPRMNTIGKALAQDVDVCLDTRVHSLQARADGWELFADGDSSIDTVDWVFVTAPLAQTRTLLAGIEALEAAIGDREMLGCYALMLGFEHHLELSFDTALVREADISWMSVNSSKPGRNAMPTMVVHATNRWADANLDLDKRQVLQHMLAEVSRITGVDMSVAAHTAVQRWRYANSPKHDADTHFLDSDLRLGVAGDWWIRGRVEAAFSSARALLDEFNS